MRHVALFLVLALGACAHDPYLDREDTTGVGTGPVYVKCPDGTQVLRGHPCPSDQQ
jgi:hypothetical protein